MRRQAFDGVNVLDLAWAGTGPQIVEYLAANGATVVHIDSKVRPDTARASAPFKDSMPGLNRSGYAALYSPNKYSVLVNLTHPKGPELVKKFVPWAHVVIDAYTPGVMEKFGLDYESLRKIKPDIIMFETCMQGQTGPDAKSKGTGFTLAGLSGFTNLVGWPDCTPSAPYGPYTDYICPPLGATALLAALDYHRRTGKGQYLDFSQLEAGVHFLAPLFLDWHANRRVADRVGNRDAHAAPHGAYPCKGDDRWCAIAIRTEGEWKAFCSGIGNPRWTRDAKFASFAKRKENEDELDKLVAAWICNFSAEEVMMKLQNAGVPAGVVQTPKDIYADPQLKEREYWWVGDAMEIGPFHHPTLPFKLSKTPSVLWRGSPNLGQDTEFIFTKVWGMSDEEFTQLLIDGVLE